MNYIEEATELFSNGYVCSQAVFATFSPYFDFPKEYALKIGAWFGSSMRKGEVCGACTGALMVLDLKYGEDKSLSNRACEYFLEKFKAEMDHTFAMSCLNVT